MRKEKDLSVDQDKMWERIKETLKTGNAREIAGLMSVTKQAVYDWQRGATPSLEILLKIASAGKVSLHWLITGEGHRKASFLSKEHLKAVEKLAVSNGITFEEQAAKLIENSLINLDLLKDSRSKTLQKFLKLFEEIESSERSVVADYLIREIISKDKER